VRVTLHEANAEVRPAVSKPGPGRLAHLARPGDDQVTERAQGGRAGRRHRWRLRDREDLERRRLSRQESLEPRRRSVGASEAVRAKQRKARSFPGARPRRSGRSPPPPMLTRTEIAACYKFMTAAPSHF
jgi:hypothetical protein